MQVRNSYYWYNSIINSDLCQKIISLGKNKIDYLKSKGIDISGVTIGNKEKQSMVGAVPMQDKTNQELIENTKIKNVEENVYVRDSDVAWLDDKWLYDLLLPHIYDANKKAGWFYDLDGYEMFQFTVYRPGGFYGWHTDGETDHLSKYRRYIPGISPTDSNGKMLKNYTRHQNLVGKVRKVSMTLNLNQPGEYEGGNLKFDFGPHTTNNRFHECLEIRPQGSMIVFPSYVYHQVTPVTRGTRYSLVLWNLGKPFK
jgi:PKHD-type hydroxylase